VTQVVQCLLSKHEALSSNPNIKKKKKELLLQVGRRLPTREDMDKNKGGEQSSSVALAEELSTAARES
jgi:hypothetical protein